MRLLGWFLLCVFFDFSQQGKPVTIGGEDLCVSYVYFEHAKRADRSVECRTNLEFFLLHGYSARGFYLFTLNGHICTVKIPQADNVKVISRDNFGLDIAAHGEAMQWFDRYKPECNYFFFLNCGVRGPFVPPVFPTFVHWSVAFTQHLDGYVKLVGPSVVALHPSDPGGWGPRVESYCFCIDKEALKLFLETGSSFTVHDNKEKQIIDGEYGASRTILNAGYSLASLLTMHANLDWRDTKNWDLNGNLHPTRPGFYDGMDVHPFEVMFHKKRWDLCDTCSRHVSAVEEEKYTAWLNQGKARLTNAGARMIGSITANQPPVLWAKNRLRKLNRDVWDREIRKMNEEREADDALLEDTEW